jgi:hypothetical protein
MNHSATFEWVIRKNEPQMDADGRELGGNEKTEAFDRISLELGNSRQRAFPRFIPSICVHRRPSAVAFPISMRSE